MQIHVVLKTTFFKINIEKPELAFSNVDSNLQRGCLVF